MLENKKIIIFDLDGTLIESVGVWNKIDEELIKAIGGSLDDNIDIGKRRDAKLAEFSKSADAYIEYCGYLGKIYSSHLSALEIREKRYKIAEQLLRDDVDYKPFVPETLKFLKEKGFTLVIGSTTNDYTINVYKIENKNIIQKAPMEEYFKAIYSKGAVNELKPNPALHYRIMEDFKVKPEECLIIEDSLIGVQAAKNAGIDVAVMYDKYSDANREEINKLADYRFNNFEELLNTLKEELGE